MRVKKRFKITFAFIFWTAYLLSQNQIQTCKFFVFQADSIAIDSLSIYPESLKILSKGREIKSEDYHLLPDAKSIRFHKKSGLKKGDSLQVFYQSLPLDLSKRYFHKDYEQWEKNKSISVNPFLFQPENLNRNNSLLSDDKLTKNGSISRGILFGNNQDVVLNSNMNLQVSGKLTKDVEIVLAATDNNIPIQADGNTQQLQEFDKVYVQLNNQNSKLIVGDFQYGKPQSYFMNFYKRTQGLFLSNFTSLNPLKRDSSGFQTLVSAAISRGRFSRFSVQGIENNQGPYRLRGADNEQFIIVLSGTEKVYVDGKLLERGQENDYIIDYNSSEITFTAKQIITKDKRIIVEFQYAERNYSRSLLFLSEQFQTEKWKAGIHFYSEQDNKNRPFQQELSQDQKKLLLEIGDTLDKAISNGASIAEFNTIEVFYEKKDTLSSSGTFQIFKYSTLPDTAYRVRFSYVGEGRGNYVQIQSTANGKVFEWREPLNGIKRGNYEPILPLVTPKQKQMFVTRAERKLGTEGKIEIESAFTKNDLNTFSPYNSNDDQGAGIKLNFNHKKKINPSDSSKNQNPLFILFGSNYELVTQHFAQIERFRNIEFNRDWNRKNDSIKNLQHVFSLSTGIEKKGKIKSLYTGQGFSEGTNYQGIKHLFSNSINLKKLQLIYNASLLETKTQYEKTVFYRHKSLLSQKLGKFSLNYIDEFEKNEFGIPNKDSLTFNSYQFWEWETNVATTDTSGNRFKIFYRERTDKKPKSSQLLDATYAQSFGGSVQINSNPNHIFATTLTYRKLVVRDSTLFFSKPDNTLLTRIEYSPRIRKGLITGAFFYETGYGLEPRREYSYIQVAAGQGQYTWKDYNDDGIKQLNEFEIAQFSDQATFIKVFTPTNTYVKAAHDQFSGSILIKPAALKTKSSGKFLLFIAKFASQTIYRIDKKKTVNPGKFSYNPFDNNLNDSSLLFSNSSLRQALFFNQSSGVGGFDYTYQKNESKQLLTNGFETRGLENHELRTRINFTRSLALFTQTTYGFKSLSAELLTNRNYRILLLETEPKISYQPNTSLRISSGFKYSEKQNIFNSSNEKAIIQDLNLELKLSKLNKGNLDFKADYILIDYSSKENTPLAFEMLNALRPGQNFTWTISYQQNLSAYLQISFNYEGRKSPGNKSIHIGGAQVRALF